MSKHELRLEPLCEVLVYDSLPIGVGPSSWGIRLIAPVLEGTVTGPRLQGEIRQFGADWGVIRADGCLDLDVRLLIDTNDGAIIHTTYRGIAPMSKGQVEEFLSGAIPEGLTFYVTPRFETSHEDYQWLTRVQAVGCGAAELDGDRLKVTYSWYTLAV